MPKNKESSYRRMLLTEEWRFREAVFNDDEKEYELIDGQQLSGGTTAKGLEREEEKQSTTLQLPIIIPLPRRRQ